MPKRTDKSIEEKVMSLYLEGKSFNKVAKECDLHSCTVGRIIKRNGISIPHKERVRKYSFDSSFFSDINTEEKAYWLGFIVADGYLMEDGLRIALSTKDINHLEEFKKAIKSDHPISITASNGFDVETSVCVIAIYSTEIVKQLNKLGLTNNKTFDAKFPILKPELIHHFARGFFDGDGSISTYQVFNNKPHCPNYYTKYEVTFTGTIDFLSDIKSYMIQAGLNPDVKLQQRHKDRDNNVRTLKYSGKRNAQKIFSYLYKDATVFLQRKYVRFINNNIAVQ